MLAGFGVGTEGIGVGVGADRLAAQAEAVNTTNANTSNRTGFMSVVFQSDLGLTTDILILIGYRPAR